MLPQKQAEEAIVSTQNETATDREVSKDEESINEGNGFFSVKSILWHGGSAWDAWFSCASNQVAQVLLTLPYSFSQMGMLSGIILQIFYGLVGSWTAYLISVLYIEYRTRKEKENVNFKNHVIQWFEVLDGLLGPYWKALGLAFNCTFLLFGSVIQLIGCASNIYYINDHLDKRTWTYIFGACCATTVFIPSFHNYRIWSFLGLGMTTYTAWYMTAASIAHGQGKLTYGKIGEWRFDKWSYLRGPPPKNLPMPPHGVPESVTLEGRREDGAKHISKEEVKKPDGARRQDRRR